VDLPDQMVRRHHLVEIKRVKQLPLSTLSPPHHGPLPRITSQSDGITVRPRSQREFCNTFGGKADIDQPTLAYRFCEYTPYPSPADLRSAAAECARSSTLMRASAAAKACSACPSAGITTLLSSVEPASG